MTRRLFCLWIYCLCLLPLFAQSNKAIQDLKNRQGELQRRIAESETLLKTTRNLCDYAATKGMNVELEVFDFDFEFLRNPGRFTVCVQPGGNGDVPS